MRIEVDLAINKEMGYSINIEFQVNIDRAFVYMFSIFAWNILKQEFIHCLSEIQMELDSLHFVWQLYIGTGMESGGSRGVFICKKSRFARNLLFKAEG